MELTWRNVKWHLGEDLGGVDVGGTSRWWFQIFFWEFSPLFGEVILFD